jgi:hypothetical protein
MSQPSEPVENVENEVLRLRSMGRAFARISRELGLERGVDAQRAFHRAVKGLPAPERQRVRTEEVTRLDRLAERVRADTTKSDLDRARQLKTIDRMRNQTLEDA